MGSPTVVKAKGKSPGLPFAQPQTIRGLVEEVGFKGQHADEAIGIAWAESGLDASAKSKNPDGGTNIGLFQIDDKAHPQYDGLEDPLQNAKAAYEIRKGGTDWSAWATWGSGAWKAKAGKDGRIKNGGSGTVGAQAVGNPVPGNPLDFLKPIAAVAQKLLALFYPSTWERVGKVVLGIALLMWGVHTLLKASFGINVPRAIAGKAVAAAAIVK
jgi:hypothetical protein